MTVVYVASALANEIAVFVADPDDGRLESVQRLAIPAGVTPLTIGPNRQFLFAGLRGEAPSVLWFAIDAESGRLRLLGSTPLADPPMYLATGAGGRFLLSASYAAGTFAINAIGDDGCVEPAAVQHTNTPPRAHSVLTDPTDRYLFVAALGADAILQYVFDSRSGRATPNEVPFVEAPPGSGPRHMVFHPSHNVLYVNGELDASVCSYALCPDSGTLRLLRWVPMLAEPVTIEPWAAEIAITPNASHLYATERRTSTLAVFDLGGEPGALHRQQTVTTEEQPRAFAVDPRGRFLVVAGEQSAHVTVYGIDPSSGAVDARFRYPVGAKPAWVSIADLSDVVT